MTARPINDSLCQICHQPATQFISLGKTKDGITVIATFCSDQCNFEYWNLRRIEADLPASTSEYEIVDSSIIKLQKNVNLDKHEFRREEIGRAGWTILHSFSSAYPDSPNDAQKESMLKFIHGFAENYACLICREHFLQLISKKPPNVNCKKELKYWVCDAHNTVNTNLGKPQFDCNCISEKIDYFECKE